MGVHLVVVKMEVAFHKIGSIGLAILSFIKISDGTSNLGVHSANVNLVRIGS